MRMSCFTICPATADCTLVWFPIPCLCMTNAGAPLNQQKEEIAAKQASPSS